MYSDSNGRSGFRSRFSFTRVTASLNSAAPNGAERYSRMPTRISAMSACGSVLEPNVTTCIPEIADSIRFAVSKAASMSCRPRKMT